MQNVITYSLVAVLGQPFDTLTEESIYLHVKFDFELLWREKNCELVLKTTPYF